ncbi:putative disease resistance protein RGA3 isoform X2 [Brachypodium distachyon]|uniref:putative disease resistance protein RGA3 isoform X2 n=1 Tax=Brachypodium distachyon TaxID=15368 RepID=UPI00071DC449|nr:putative disease resistance protein RGA3 isoform X2 [Brachypodium distachyon]XP_024318582.1 putative disease resistance protein RGA3 isoform X2 [Brachypodium distachyon]|eukprot:XP_010238997.2 putative disease resistance protein RGA3 isoform X2 [Brachypodium distachyon]
MASVLDPLVGSCITKLQEIIADKAVLILGVKDELKKLQGTMKQIRCFLDDAEQRRIKESAVNNWLSDLRDAMYDADDIVDSARFEGSKLLKDRPSSPARNSTACCGISFLSCFPVIQKRHEIAVKIRDLNDRVEKLSKHGNSFLHLGAGPTGQGSTSKVRETSKLVQPNLVGKEIMHSSKKLVDLVLAGKERKDYKLAIVGTGGVGKTTLAQKIYNDKKIKPDFQKQAWVCVSQECNEANLLKEILRNIGVYQDQGETIAELQNRIAETIEGKSFFLVLDDVWKSSVIDLLEAPIYVVASSVILVTTRDDRIAMDIHAAHTHRVNLMSEEVGWELLWKSMSIIEEKEVQNLRNTGIEIIKKCGYLPLAIKVIARVLTSKDQTENEWKKILSKISAWSESKLHDDIGGALYLSYNELPHHLKQCFLYCALYPEDSTIERDDLVRLWVAEGFIEEQEGQLLEETGEEYYYELIYRNLLQPDGSTFDHTSCKMHDLLRQLACYLSRDECFSGDPESLEAQSMTKLRRISAVTKKDMLVFPTMDKENLKLRTLLGKFYGVSQGVDHSLFKKLLLLRVLDLTGSSIQTIPDCIANLIHLRLLNLDGTEISCLPESIGSLINLQILNLQRCDALHSLPSTITRLCNLRRLGLEDTPINQVPEGIGRLTFLNDLEGFPIGAGSASGKTQDGWKLEELGHLLQLRRLDMIKLERATTCTDSLLIDKKYLTILNLCCTKHPVESYSEDDVGNIEKIFEQLIPPHNLEDLSIADLFGRRFPTWLGTTHLVSVKYLKLIDWNSCVHLPPLWQLPNLKYLRIDGAAAVTKIGPEFVGCCREGNPRSTVAVAFPKLETLIIRDMPNWEEWSFVEEGDAAAASMEGEEDGSAEIRKGEAPSPRLQVLPCLKTLELLDCPKLRALPRQLGQEATCLELLALRGASSLKVVEDLPFLSEALWIVDCKGLERVSNLNKLKELRLSRCPELTCVEGLGSLQQLWLDDGMQDISSKWVPGLQEQHLKLHGDDLDIYTWPRG